MELKIKDEFKDEVVGFNGSGHPLGERSQEDLRWLAEQAQTVNKSHQRYFEELPELEELQAAKTTAVLAKTVQPTLPAVTNPNTVTK